MSELASEDSGNHRRTYVLVLLFFTVAAGLAMGDVLLFFHLAGNPPFRPLANGVGHSSQ